MIAFLIAVYCKNHERKCTIVSPSKTLATQLEHELFKVNKDSTNIEVVIPKLMSKTHLNMDMCIIDEADYLVEEKNFIFIKQEQELMMNTPKPQKPLL